ncbi:MAG: hypothetical protein WCH04_08275, partial [Gammaproteobacteria bacterium]
MTSDDTKESKHQKWYSMYRRIGTIWFFLCAVGGAFILDHLIRTYPTVVGPLLPAALVLLLGII